MSGKPLVLAPPTFVAALSATPAAPGTADADGSNVHRVTDTPEL